ncbi:MAG: hypothetical protein AB1656_19440 [Candidatus Omnitrophota bacterium]
MKIRLLTIVCLAAISSLVWGQTPSTLVKVYLNERLGPMNIDRMALGQGGLSEEPMWDNRIAEIRALHPKVIRLFIQEYFDLLPERGRYHFDALDRSVDAIVQAEAEPVMCICFKPAALFPEINQDIVEPNDYEEWERLIYNLVHHYKKRHPKIRYWEIGNEPDIGESGGCPYRFRPENYTIYYRRTAAAILRADPEARVGGPALANARSPILPALMNFCESQKIPLHFASWHIYTSDPRQIRQTIDYVQTELKKHPGLKPETFLDEWNIDLSNPPQDARFQPCFAAEAIWQMKEAGLDYSCYYHIRDYHVSFERFSKFMSSEGNVFMAKWWNRRPQWDGLFDYQNQIRPTYFLFKLLSRLTGERLRIGSVSDKVHGLASWDAKYQLYNLLLWNFSPTPMTVNLTLENPLYDLQVKPIVFDALTANSDENSRLKPETPIKLTRDNAAWEISLEPYGVRFWTLEK